jgi:hypothetical protein
VFLAVGLAALASIALIVVAWQAGNGGSAQSPSRRDLINGKFAANGYPTIGTDEYATNEAVSTGAAGGASRGGQPGAIETPAPFPAGCGGPLVTGGQEIIDQYGPLGNCGVYGDFLVIATLGGNAGAGIGVYECATDDDSCHSKKISARSGQWSFVAAPRPSAVRILAFAPPTTLVISNGGQMCFDLATSAFSDSSTCQ